VLQPWLLSVLEEGLGSSFHHVFGHFSFPLALFSHSTLGDLHVAGRFQSSFREEGEGLFFICVSTYNSISELVRAQAM
jgi:hypothetical protein